MIPALILFAVTYVLMLAFSKYRPYIALGSALIFIVSGMLPLDQILPSIDFNVLLMIAGTMGVVALFIESKMPALLADLVMEHVPNVQWAAVALALFAGIISAFVDNVATVLMVAPVALEICKKLKTNPVPFIIGIAVSSNLQGAATLVGDTTAIMLGSALDMSFTDFFWYHGKPSMFFAVELGAVLSALILAFLFRREKAPIPKTGERTKVTNYVPTFLLLGTIILLILASFLPNKPGITTHIDQRVFHLESRPFRIASNSNILLLVNLKILYPESLRQRAMTAIQRTPKHPPGATAPGGLACLQCTGSLGICAALMTIVTCLFSTERNILTSSRS